MQCQLHQGTTMLDRKYVLPDVELELLTSTCILESRSSKNTVPGWFTLNHTYIVLQHQIL